jgi:hypothetical protein
MKQRVYIETSVVRTRYRAPDTVPFAGKPAPVPAPVSAPTLAPEKR